MFYTNSRSLIEKNADEYGKWLDKSTAFYSDCLKIVGTIKKEEKFHAIKLFCSKQQTNSDLASDEIFNLQLLFATSGAANCGVDNENIYSMFRGEMPPSY